MTHRPGRRAVLDTIDAGGVYSSRVAAGGPFIFFGGTAIDETGRLARAARPAEPYERSAAAQVRAQARYLLERYRELLPQLGSSLQHIVAMEHYLRHKIHADGYFQTARAPGLLERDRPIAATAAVGESYPEDAVVCLTGFAIVPDASAGMAKSYPEEIAKNPLRLYPETIVAGPLICTTYLASHPTRGIDPAVRTEAWHWRGSEIRSEAEHAVGVLQRRLAVVGASLADIVDYTLFLVDPDDLYEFDLAFARALPGAAPARTVIPARGFQVPRREAAVGHAQGAPRMEGQFRCLRPGVGFEKVVVPGPGVESGVRSAAVRTGPLLWISSQVAVPEARGGVGGEIEHILENIAAICGNAGTALGNLLRVRALVRQPEDARTVYTALRRAVLGAPPVVCIVLSPPPASGCTVALDAVAYIDPVPDPDHAVSDRTQMTRMKGVVPA